MLTSVQPKGTKLQHTHVALKEKGYPHKQRLGSLPYRLEYVLLPKLTAHHSVAVQHPQLIRRRGHQQPQVVVLLHKHTPRALGQHLQKVHLTAVHRQRHLPQLQPHVTPQKGIRGRPKATRREKTATKLTVLQLRRRVAELAKHTLLSEVTARRQQLLVPVERKTHREPVHTLHLRRTTQPTDNLTEHPPLPEERLGSILIQPTPMPHPLATVPDGSQQEVQFPLQLPQKPHPVLLLQNFPEPRTETKQHPLGENLFTTLPQRHLPRNACHQRVPIDRQRELTVKSVGNSERHGSTIKRVE